MPLALITLLALASTGIEQWTQRVCVSVLSPIAFGFLPVVHHLSTGFICTDKYDVILCFSSATVNDSDSFHI